MTRASPAASGWTGATAVALVLVLVLGGAVPGTALDTSPQDSAAQAADSIRYAPQHPVVGQPVTLVAFVSTDEGTEYHWDIGSETVQGQSVEYTFEEPGEFRVRLRVVVGGETIRTSETHIVVSAESAESSAAAAGPDFRHLPATLVRGKQTTFVANGIPENQTPQWDFDGDGEPDKRGRVVQHTFQKGDTVTVTLTTTQGEAVSRELRVQPSLRELPNTVPTAELNCQRTRLCRLPGASWLLGSERILVHVERGENTQKFRTQIESVSQSTINTSPTSEVTYFVRVSDGSVTELTVVEDPNSRDPTMHVYTDEATVRRVYGSDDPGEELAQAYESGAIRVRGDGPTNRLKVGIATAVMDIADAISGAIDAVSDWIAGTSVIAAPEAGLR